MTAPLPLPDISQPTADPQPQFWWSNDATLYALTALLLFAPLAFGAVEPWAIFALESVSAVLFLLWAWPQLRSGRITVVWNPAFTPMCAFLGLLLIQMLPGFSAYRHATSSAFLLYIAYGLVCFLFTQTLSRTTHVRKLVTAFSIYGTAVAMFAVLQALSGTGKLYWLRTPRFGGWIYGPYVNHNHYAGLMEMLVPMPLVFAFSRYAQGRKRWLAVSASAFMGATIFLSGSRGGMSAFAVQIAIFFWLVFRERTRNRFGLLLCAFLLVAFSSVIWMGGSEVAERISTLRDHKRSDVTADFRLAINRDCLSMFARRPFLGWGLSTFPNVYPQFRSFYTNLLVNEAHNDYSQVLVETGAIGFGIVIWFLAVVLRPAFRKTRNWPSDVNGMVSLAALLGISGILVHSFLDFNLEIPANAMMFYTLCGLAAMEPRFRNFRRQSKGRTLTPTFLPTETVISE